MAKKSAKLKSTGEMTNDELFRAKLLSPHWAELIYSVLVEHAGATESFRSEFVDDHIRGHCTEYRFCGSLGVGGKFYVERDAWRVSCYSEDLTPERQETIKRTNDALKTIRSSRSARAHFESGR